MADEAALDATATEKLKSNCGTHVGVLLEPLAVGLAQFVDETSRGGDFMERLVDDEPGLDMEELFNRWTAFEAAEFFKKQTNELTKNKNPVSSESGADT